MPRQPPAQRSGPPPGTCRTRYGIGSRHEQPGPARMTRLRRVVGAAALVLAVAVAAIVAVAGAQETPGPSAALTGNGRHLEPAGRLTQVGSFPTGGALTPDGR